MLTIKTLLLEVLLTSLVVRITQAANMNGEYLFSKTPKQDLSKFSGNFEDYPGKPKYFDVYSPPIKTLYSQVFWTALEPVDLPKEVVEEFHGKVMAIVGFETDQVRVNEKNEEVSVPINVAYNHHFESFMASRKVRFVKRKSSDLDMKERVGHRMPEEVYVAEHVDGEPLVEGHLGRVPFLHEFGAANGGEYRKSFHGWAPGHAALIQSPAIFQITPMQIDTWNRDEMDINGGPFVAGPLPTSSFAPPNASYSGLLECPVTTRVTKEYDIPFAAKLNGQCSRKLSDMESCLKAAKKLGFQQPSSTKTINSMDQPSGCSARIDSNDKVEVILNTETESTQTCGGQFTEIAGKAVSLVDVHVHVDGVKDAVTITLSGPSEVWFGVGFNAQSMSDKPWAVIAEGDGRVTEHRLEDQGGGATHTELPPSIVVESNNVVDGVRTVVVTRPLKGKFYSFDVKRSKIPFINAIGNTVKLHHHEKKTPATLSLFPRDAPICLCSTGSLEFGKIHGNLVYPNGEKVRFDNFCLPYPRTDLLKQKNPACDLRAYAGGQLSCHHMVSLLDADQEIPWQDQPIEYRLKFRFWYEEYKATPVPSHLAVKRVTWGLASPVEYDVPKCNATTMGCSFNGKDWIHTITGTWKVPSGKAEKKLVAAHFHCHAPTCLKVTLYDNTTGEEICSQSPIYGGKGEVDQKKFDEVGYIAQPPCLWGSPEQGFQPPIPISGKTLHAVKTSYANNGHHGEMAWLQCFVVTEPKKHLRYNAIK